MSRARRGGTEEGSGREWILVGADFSASARQALLRALSIARERNARLLVLHAIDAHGLDEIARLAGVPESDLRERLARERREQLAGVVHEVRDGDSALPVELIVSWGVPFEEILRKATDFAVELIVLGTAGRSADLQRALFGSTAEKVLRATPCPVLCVPTD